MNPLPSARMMLVKMGPEVEARTEPSPSALLLAGVLMGGRHDAGAGIALALALDRARRECYLKPAAEVLVNLSR